MLDSLNNRKPKWADIISIAVAASLGCQLSPLNARACNYLVYWLSFIIHHHTQPDFTHCWVHPISTILCQYHPSATRDACNARDTSPAHLDAREPTFLYPVLGCHSQLTFVRFWISTFSLAPQCLHTQNVCVQAGAPVGGS